MALTFTPIVNPVRQLLTLKQRPRWAGRFIVLAALYTGLGWAGNGYRADLAVDRLPPSASVQDRIVARETIMESTLTNSLFQPVRLFLGWSAFSLVLFYTCGVWRTREKARFVHFLAAEVRAEVAMFLGNAASFGAILLGTTRGEPTIAWIPAGFDLVIASDDFLVRYLLNSFNLFSVAYIAILSVTISNLLGLSRPKAITSVLFAWGLTLFANVGILHALRVEFHLSP